MAGHTFGFGDWFKNLFNGNTSVKKNTINVIENNTSALLVLQDSIKQLTISLEKLEKRVSILEKSTVKMNKNIESTPEKIAEIIEK